MVVPWDFGLAERLRKKDPECQIQRTHTTNIDQMIDKMIREQEAIQEKFHSRLDGLVEEMNQQYSEMLCMLTRIVEHQEIIEQEQDKEFDSSIAGEATTTNTRNNAAANTPTHGLIASDRRFPDPKYLFSTQPVGDSTIRCFDFKAK